MVRVEDGLSEILKKGWFDETPKHKDHHFSTLDPEYFFLTCFRKNKNKGHIKNQNRATNTP